jgi:hypothetical protein
MHDLRGIDETENRPKIMKMQNTCIKKAELPYSMSGKLNLDSCIDKSTVITYGIVQTGEHVEGGIRSIKNS